MAVSQNCRENLIKKIHEEEDCFKKWLLVQPPEEILHHASEYTIREDLVIMIENATLSESEASFLLSSQSLLADLHKDFSKLEPDHLTTLRYCLKKRIFNMRKKQDEGIV